MRVFWGKKEKLDEARLFTFLIWAVISNGFAKKLLRSFIYSTISAIRLLFISNIARDSGQFPSDDSRHPRKISKYFQSIFPEYPEYEYPVNLFLNKINSLFGDFFERPKPRD